MATSKRERQRANRELGQQEAEVVEEQVEKKRSFMKYGLIVAAIIIGLLIFALSGRGGDDNSVTIATNGATATTADLEGWSRDAGSQDAILRDGIYSEPSPQVLDTSKDYEAVIQTENGAMRFRLLDEAAPVTVNNFVNLSNDGFYNDLTFHRVIDGFMAQGGDPTGTGRGGPGYKFENEYTEGIEFDKRGQLAMANSGLDTNGSQFFITFNGTNGLPADTYTIFGELIEGDDVLGSISLRDPAPGNPPGDTIDSITIETIN